MNGIAKIGGWLHLPLNPLRMQKLTENYVSSNAKIKKALGIVRFPVDAREGLIETIKCFKDGKQEFFMKKNFIYGNFQDSFYLGPYLFPLCEDEGFEQTQWCTKKEKNCNQLTVNVNASTFLNQQGG